MDSNNRKFGQYNQNDSPNKVPNFLKIDQSYQDGGGGGSDNADEEELFHKIDMEQIVKANLDQ